MSRDRLSESSRRGDQTPGSTGQRPESRDRLSGSSRRGDQTPGSTGQRLENRDRPSEERDPAGDRALLLSPGELTAQSTKAIDYINAFCDFMMRCCSRETTSDIPQPSQSPSLIVEQPSRIDQLPNFEAPGATYLEESQSPVDSHPALPRADASPASHSTEVQIAAGLARRPPSDSEGAGLETNKQMDASSLTTTSTGIESKDQHFQDHFRAVLQEKNLSVSLTDELDRHTSIREIWGKHGKEVARAFAIARGKAKREIIERESLLYQKKDKDISEYFLEHSDPSEEEANNDKNMILVNNIFSRGSDVFGCLNSINIDTGEFVGISNFNDRKKTKANLSDIKFHQIFRALKYGNKTFKDFNLERVIGKFITNDDVKDTMRLFLEKDGQPFEDGSDGFEAYVGTQVGESNVRLTAEHPTALKSRKPMSVTVNIGASEIICTFGNQEHNASGESLRR